MARIRTIKPEFWTSEQVVACSATARLMFIGLWNYCDDGGRMPYRPTNIKMRIFPGDDISSEDIRRFIGELSANGLISLYEVEDQPYLQVTGWKHQKIDRPTYQFPDACGTVPEGKGFTPKHHDRRAFDERSTPEGKGRESKGKERNGMEGNGREERARARGSPPAAPDDDWPDDYRNQFEKLYPQKVRMAAALDMLEGVRRGGKVTWEFFHAKLKAYAEKTDDAFWASPTNWIREERWNDEPAPQPARRNGTDAEKPRTLAGRAAERVREMEAASSPPAPGSPPGAVGGAEIGGDHARVISAAQRE
jgi:hypothetical protein